MTTLEPTLIRCARCDALVALQDAARCETHETDPLCPFCWRHHIETHPSVSLSESCWAMVPLPLTWRSGPR